MEDLTLSSKDMCLLVQCSRDLYRLYSQIYEPPGQRSDSVVSFLAYNSVHAHGKAIEALKGLINSKDSASIASFLSESPLFSILVPIAADEYDVDLLSMPIFSCFLNASIDKLSILSNEGLKKFLARIPANYMITHLNRIVERVDNDQQPEVSEGWSRLKQLVLKAFADHFLCPSLYIEQIIQVHHQAMPKSNWCLPIDSTFLRVFGHTIYQPDWVAREFQLLPPLYRSARAKPIFMVPDPSSILGSINRYLSNSYILDAWKNLFGDQSAYGSFISLHNFSQLISVDDLVSFLPWEYSINDILTKGRLVTYNETGSTVYQKTQSSVSIDLSKILRSSIHPYSKNRLTKHKLAILHVRSSAFYGDNNHRNSNISSYRLVCEHLYQHGYEIHNYSNPEFRQHLMPCVFDYSRYKTKRLDALLLSQAELFISTPSGIGGMGRLFGAQELVTNFWPYSFDGITTILSVMPKVVIERVTGRVLSLKEVISITLTHGNRFFDASNMYEVRENTELELLEGIKDYFSGRMVRLDSYIDGCRALAPASFMSKYYQL